jgi:Na+/proline symporter
VAPALTLSLSAGYFSLLLVVAFITSRRANNDSYFLGNKVSPWMAVAFGMLSDSLSGVTFISVPGAVGTTHFSYLQVVLGYFVGYFVITELLLPLYYKRNLTSIYSYLGQRIGNYSQMTGSFFFLVSRLLGAAARLYLTASIIQVFVFNELGVPFWVTVTVVIALILVYTYRGGIKTLVWTDALQSGFLLAGVILSIVAISRQLGFGLEDLVTTVSRSDLSTTFFWDVNERSFFPKQFIGGLFIAIAMTGLDQNMMQKNLSMRTLGDAQKNLRSFSFVMLVVTVCFLCLGVLLYTFLEAQGLSLPLGATGKPDTDALFPMLALDHLGNFAGIVFVLGLTAATFSSADSVLTTLTTSFMIDFIGVGRWGEARTRRTRHVVHVIFAIALLLVILGFREWNNQALITTVLDLANFTYGPLLGLFAFGMFTRLRPNDNLVPMICIVAPLICLLVRRYSGEWLGDYQIGQELIVINALLTFMGLAIISRPRRELQPAAL